MQALNQGRPLKAIPVQIVYKLVSLYFFNMIYLYYDLKLQNVFINVFS